MPGVWVCWYEYGADAEEQSRVSQDEERQGETKDAVRMLKDVM